MRYRIIHGHRRAYFQAGPKIGEAPIVFLLHGLAADHHTWDDVIPVLAEHYTVIAPDLLGHGESDKPRGDYSLGAYADGMRDLMTVLGIDRATFVGHSFGGGVALQLTYQHPERVERLVLVDTGGVDKEVSIVLRLLSLPLVAEVMAAVGPPVLGAAMRAAERFRPGYVEDLRGARAFLNVFRDPDARHAVHRLIAGIIDWRGQIVTVGDRVYLTHGVPMAIVWGENDPIIPVAHADRLAGMVPNAHVTILRNAGHEPHMEHPIDFAELVHDFIATTTPATHEPERWRHLLTNGKQAAFAAAGLVDDDALAALRPPRPRRQIRLWPAAKPLP